MNFKQKLAYIAIGCLFTLASCFLLPYFTGFNPQSASAQDTEKRVIDGVIHEKIPNAEEIQSDLIGRRVYTRRTVEWIDISSMEYFTMFTIRETKTYRYIVEYQIEIGFVDGSNVLLHIAYRKTATGWKLVATRNLRR